MTGETETDRLERLMRDRWERPLPRRFYERVTVEETADGFAVSLDGKLARTPLKHPLLLPTRALAEAVAAEWAAQEEKINPFAMPLTGYCNAAIDRVRPDPPAVIALIAETASHELLCYRAEGPEELARKQAAAWDPLLDWAAERLQVAFNVTSGIMPVAQAPALRPALMLAYGRYSEFVLAALAGMAQLTGSAVLPLAVAEGRITPEDAFAAAHLEEQWNIDSWGADAEATARLDQRRAEFLAAARLLALVR